MDLTDALYEAADDGVATITLNRPEQRNALGPRMLADLTAALRAARDDDAVRAVVLTGAGDKAFCAGADLAGFAAEPRGAAPRERGELRRALPGLRAARQAAGRLHHRPRARRRLRAGAVLRPAGAADTATFGTPEIKVGVWPMMIISIVTRNLGRKRALELFMTGDAHRRGDRAAMGLRQPGRPRDEGERAAPMHGRPSSPPGAP